MEEEKENKRSFRDRFEHKQLILEEAEENPVIITMNFSSLNARSNYNKCWTELTAKLNSLGYGEKSQDKRRRLLTDWVSVTKAKYSKLKKHCNQTGGGPPSGIELTSLEETLMAIKGFRCVDLNSSTPKLGLISIETETAKYSTSEVMQTEEEVIILDIQESNETPQKKQKRNLRKKVSKLSINKTIHGMHDETLKELKIIRASMEIIADCMLMISNNLKT